MRQKAPQPWIALGMSRATWYRLAKPSAKPTRVTQPIRAYMEGVSLRSLQREARILRKAPSLANEIEAGSLKLGRAERILFPTFSKMQPDGTPQRLGNKPLFTQQEFKTILMCLHPDGVRSPEKLHAAFIAVKARERHLTRKKRS
jgi:hypothetical protein